MKSFFFQGSISSSAPVQAKLDFTEYFEIVKKSLETAQAGCDDIVRRSFLELQSIVESGYYSKETKLTLMKLFNLCDFDIEDPKTRITFYSFIHDLLSGLVQYNHDNRVSF